MMAVCAKPAGDRVARVGRTECAFGLGQRNGGVVVEFHTKEQPAKPVDAAYALAFARENGVDDWLFEHVVDWRTL